MSLFRVQNNVPDIYENASRDFQLFSRLYDAVLCGVKYDIDSMINIVDTSEIKSNILSLLQTKLGFFTNANIQEEYLRKILLSFPEIIKYKGSKIGISKALLLFMHLQNKNINFEILYDGGTVNILLYEAIGNLTLLEEILNYVLPTGCKVEYKMAAKSSEKFSLGEHVSVINTSEDVNSNIKIPLNEFGGSDTTYIIDDALLINIAEFSSQSTYSVGDYVIYQNQVYICTQDVSTPGEWDASDWSATTAEQTKSVKENSDFDQLLNSTDSTIVN